MTQQPGRHRVPETKGTVPEPTGTKLGAPFTATAGGTLAVGIAAVLAIAMSGPGTPGGRPVEPPSAQLRPPAAGPGGAGSRSGTQAGFLQVAALSSPHPVPRPGILASVDATPAPASSFMAPFTGGVTQQSVAGPAAPTTGQDPSGGSPSPSSPGSAPAAGSPAGGPPPAQPTPGDGTQSPPPGSTPPVVSTPPVPSSPVPVPPAPTVPSSPVPVPPVPTVPSSPVPLPPVPTVPTSPVPTPSVPSVPVPTPSAPSAPAVPSVSVPSPSLPSVPATGSVTAPVTGALGSLTQQVGQVQIP
ncbi:MAG: hypothetical protein ACXVGE_21450 [Blastococcus sp.]